MNRCPVYDAVHRARQKVVDCGYRLAVFVCHGAGTKDTIHTAPISSSKFRELENKDYYELVGVYGPEITLSDMLRDIQSMYKE